MIIRPAKSLRGPVKLPGDKSISHRAAMIASMAAGESRIENFATSVDCASTLQCLRKLGVGIRQEGSTVRVKGVDRYGFVQPIEALDCGNSGTTIRLIAGILAGQNFDSVLTGDGSLRRRPMKRVIEPLTAMGAEIESEDGRAPLKIRGKDPLESIEYRLPVASAQIKSCVLLAGLSSSGRTSVIEPVVTRDHTERMLRWFGVEITDEPFENGKKISVDGGTRLTARDLIVPADISAAAFFMIAAASLPGSEIELNGVGLNPSRIAVIDVLTMLGADIQITNRREHNNEPIGDIVIGGDLGVQSETIIRGSVVPNLIDEIPILAVFGTQLENGLEVRDARELRVKESDRIASIVQNLRSMGADVEEFDDGFRVGRSNLKGGRVDSFGDHRIAMAFAVAGLLTDEGETEIVGAECVDVSFPGFFDVLQNAIV